MTGQESGAFADEIVPIDIKERKGVVSFSADEHPRKDTTADSIAKLRPVFKENGVTTAGNASGISDGAGAIVVASEAAVKKYGLKPLARIVSSHTCGVPPEIIYVATDEGVESFCGMDINTFIEGECMAVT